MVGAAASSVTKDTINKLLFISILNRTGAKDKGKKLQSDVHVISNASLMLLARTCCK